MTTAILLTEYEVALARWIDCLKEASLREQRVKHTAARLARHRVAAEASLQISQALYAASLAAVRLSRCRADSEGELAPGKRIHC